MCENRASRDEEIGPGGLRLLGVKESPLGYYPTVPVAATHEHFFHQLRQVWTDDCPRLFVQLGLQPSPGVHRNWFSVALWLHYFNSSGNVFAVEAIDHYLGHFQNSLRSSTLSSMLNFVDGDRAEDSDFVNVHAVRAFIAEKGPKKSKERPVSFDGQDGSKILAADEVMRFCSHDVDTDAVDERHPCARILKRIAEPEPLEYMAPVRSFDEIWKGNMQGRHIDFLQIGLNVARMSLLLKKGFKDLFDAREVSIVSFQVDNQWSKDELAKVVEWFDKKEYFSMFKLVCKDSRRANSAAYFGPGGTNIGPTTYLPLSGIDFEKYVVWDELPLPQDVMVFDLRQPEIFRTVQLGDASCDVDEDSCKNDGSGNCSSEGIPERPEQVVVAHVASRFLTLEWVPSSSGPLPEMYAFTIDPGSVEGSIAHDDIETTGVQTHSFTSLRQDTEYTIRLKAIGQAGASNEVTVIHRTPKEIPSASTRILYEVAEGLHCSMSSAEEVTPTGPVPGGTSFFQDVSDPDGCQALCDDHKQCVAFQVKTGEACWLYRRKPKTTLMSGPRHDIGWWCGVKKH